MPTNNIFSFSPQDVLNQKIQAENAIGLQTLAQQADQQQMAHQKLSDALEQAIQPYKIQQMQAEATAAPLTAEHLRLLNQSLTPEGLNAAVQRKIQENAALYGMRPQNQFIIDPVTGAVSLGNKRTGEISPATQSDNGSAASITPQASLTEVSDANGNKYKVRIDKAGNILPGTPTLSETAKGQVVTDPVTGQVSVVNNILPSNSAPSTANNVSINDNKKTPFSITPKGLDPEKIQQDLNSSETVKHYKEVAERANTIPQLLEQAKQTGDYRIADNAINEELQRLISNQAIRGNAMNLLYKGQPIFDKVKGTLSSWLDGGNGYTDATRQAAADVASTLLNSAKEGRDAEIDAKRNAYPNKELFDNQIGAAFPGYSPKSSKSSSEIVNKLKSKYGLK